MQGGIRKRRDPSREIEPFHDLPNMGAYSAFRAQLTEILTRFEGYLTVSTVRVVNPEVITKRASKRFFHSLDPPSPTPLQALVAALARSFDGVLQAHNAKQCPSDIKLPNWCFRIDEACLNGNDDLPEAEVVLLMFQLDSKMYSKPLSRILPKVKKSFREVLDSVANQANFPDYFIKSLLRTKPYLLAPTRWGSATIPAMRLRSFDLPASIEQLRIWSLAECSAAPSGSSCGISAVVGGALDGLQANLSSHTFHLVFGLGPEVIPENSPELTSAFASR